MSSPLISRLRVLNEDVRPGVAGSPPLCWCDLRGRRSTWCSRRGRMYALCDLRGRLRAAWRRIS